MAKLTLTKITSANQPAVINANYDLIEAAVENQLSRDGTTPNTMSAPIDANGQKIINLALATAATDAVSKAYLDTALTGAGFDHVNLLNVGSFSHAFLDGHVVNTDLHYSDAPADGSDYVRRDNGWELIVGGATIPSQGGQANNMLTTNGTSLRWDDEIALGGPTGGLKGAGNINIAASHYINNVIQHETIALPTDHVSLGDRYAYNGAQLSDIMGLTTIVHPLTAWETYGPNSSGADNELDFYDVVPVGAKGIIMILELGGIADGAQSTCDIEIFNREVGSALTQNEYTRIGRHVWGQTPANELSVHTSEVVIPCDTDRVIELGWDDNGNIQGLSQVARFYYRGFYA